MTSSVKIPLRDEILAIRELLGYSNTCQVSSARNVYNLGTALANSSMRDVLFIGIDVDTYQGYEHLASDPQFHIGISILDTRVLYRLAHENLSSPRVIDAIESYQFVVGNSKYCNKASRKFLFGKSQSVPLEEVKAQIESLVCSRGRDNVLVFHGDHCDRKALSNLNIQLRPLCIIDNVKAAQYPLNLPYRLGLEAMLDAFGIPYANLHAAGNDAHYALRSLLMIAVTDGIKLEMQPGSQRLFSIFSAIALSPRPITAGEREAAFQDSRHQHKAEKKARYKTRRAARTERRVRAREASNEAGLSDDQCSQTEDDELADMGAFANLLFLTVLGSEQDAVD
jgi:hypothetical protein